LGLLTRTCHSGDPSVHQVDPADGVITRVRYVKGPPVLRKGDPLG